MNLESAGWKPRIYHKPREESKMRDCLLSSDGVKKSISRLSGHHNLAGNGQGNAGKDHVSYDGFTAELKKRTILVYQWYVELFP